MINPNEYDNGMEYPVEINEDPFKEKTVYDVEKITFKNKRKKEKIKEIDLFDDENKWF